MELFTCASEERGLTRLVWARSRSLSIFCATIALFVSSDALAYQCSKAKLIVAAQLGPDTTLPIPHIYLSFNRTGGPIFSLAEAHSGQPLGRRLQNPLTLAGDEVAPDLSAEWNFVDPAPGDDVGKYNCTDEVDHPFVATPDGWDALYLLGPSQGKVVINELRITYDNLTSMYSAEPTTMLIHDASSAPIVLRPGDVFSLVDHIRRMRVDTVQEAISQACPSCSYRFEDLPRVVREAAYDIGQSGTYKVQCTYMDPKTTYSDWLHDSGNGCDEFTGWAAASFDAQASDFESLCSSVSNAASGANIRTAVRHWPWSGYAESGRLARLVVDSGEAKFYLANVPPGNQTGPASYPPILTSPYEPKPGDRFFRVGLCPGGGGANHAMVLLTPPKLTSDGNGLEAAVIEGASRVVGRRRLNLPVGRQVRRRHNGRARVLHRHRGKCG